jgi:hypothetical protein
METNCSRANEKVHWGFVYSFGFGEFCFLYVSQCVPKVFLKIFPIAPHFLSQYCLAVVQHTCVCKLLRGLGGQRED